MKKVFAIMCAVLVMVCAIIPCFASELPMPTFPQQYVSLSSVTRQDAQNMVRIATTMREVGALNSLRPVFIRRLTTGTICLYCCSQLYAPTPDLSGENVNIGNVSVYQFYLTSAGYSFSSYIGQVVVPSDQVIATFTTTGASINTSFAFGSGDPNATIISADAYWEQYALRLATDSSSALQGAYNSGYEAGYNTGYDDGVGEGYAIAYGDGYADGESAGRASGFEEGYTVGYTTGYDAGVTAGGGTGGEGAITLNIPSIFDSMFNGIRSILSGVDINIFGISILGMLVAFLVIAVVAFIVRKLWK